MRNKVTIQGMIDSGHRAHAYCHNPKCGHHAELDWRGLRDRLGPDHGALRGEIEPLLVCSKCGGKAIGLIMTPGPEGVGVSPYEKAKSGR